MAQRDAYFGKRARYSRHGGPYAREKAEIMILEEIHSKYNAYEYRM